MQTGYPARPTADRDPADRSLFRETLAGAFDAPYPATPWIELLLDRIEARS